jgi:alanyl aminopeptidase
MAIKPADRTKADFFNIVFSFVAGDPRRFCTGGSNGSPEPRVNDNSPGQERKCPPKTREKSVLFRQKGVPAENVRQIRNIGLRGAAGRMAGAQNCRYQQRSVSVEHTMKTKAILAAFVFATLLASCGKNDSAQTSPAALAEKEAVPLGQLSKVVMPKGYRLTLTIEPKKPRFSGHTEIDVNFTKARRSVFLHGLDMHVSRVVVKTKDGKMVAGHYAQVDDSGVARVIFDDQVPAGAATLVFDYDAPFNTSLEGLYKVMDGGEAYAFTQFESTDARRAFPSFDEPGFKTPFDVKIVAPAEDKVVANTPVASQSKTANGLTQTVFERTKPLPTYLIALAVGPLDIVDGGDIPANAYRNHPIHLRGVTAKGKGEQIRYQLSLTPKIVEALENYFAIGYPYQKLDILAVPDFAAGAMENAGAITYRERLLLMPDSAPFDQRRSGLLVQAHELTHQWFGDLVTPTWWTNTWLNESFANWLENKASAAVKPDWDFGRNAVGNSTTVMDLDELASARQIHQPIKTNYDIENAFDSITYDKGNAVLAMFESYLGEEAMRRGVHAYLMRFAFGNASASDFINTIADTTGHHEIVAAFDSYIDQPGIPDVKVSVTCTPQAVIAHVSQTLYTPIGRPTETRQWGVPMCFEGAPGNTRVCQLVSTPSADIALGNACPTALMPNAGGVGYYRFALEEKAWTPLIQSAPRLDAADQLALVHNVNAALHADQTNANNLFAAMTFTAPTAKFDLIDAERKMLHKLRASVLSGDLTAYRAFVAKQFGPRLAVLGLAGNPSEPPPNGIARMHLAELMVEEARDPAVTAALTRAASTYLDSGGKNLGGISIDLLQEALRAGVASQGTPFAERLLTTFLASRDENFRRSILYALSGSEDAAFLKKFFDVALTPQMRVGELRYIFAYPEVEPGALPVLWSWFKANYDGLVRRVSLFGMSRSPTIGDEMCTPEMKADFDAFFEPKLKSLPGADRRFALANERIDRCLAFKLAKGTELEAALKAAK